MDVTVNNVAPTLTISGASSVNEGSTYTLGLSVNDPGTDTIDHWTITWGDGNTETVNGHPANVTRNIPQPAQWAKSGSYPTTYSVNYDASAKEFRVTLGGLTKR